MSEPRFKIFAFCNGGSPGWYNCTALSEDGVFLAGHVCSSPSWGPHDMGVENKSDWHHEAYKAYYPLGFEVVWVEVDDPLMLAAYERHKAMSHEEYDAKSIVLHLDVDSDYQALRNTEAVVDAA